MTKSEAIEIIKRVDICANAAETARDMAINALQNDTTTLKKVWYHYFIFQTYSNKRDG